MNFRPKYKYIISHLRFFNQNISLISSFHLSEFSPKIYIFNVIFVNFHPKYTCLISSNANNRVELWKNVLTINKPFLSKFSPNLILSERQRRHIFWIMMDIKRGLFQIKLVPMWGPKCFAGCLPEKLNGHR